MFRQATDIRCTPTYNLNYKQYSKIRGSVCTYVVSVVAAIAESTFIHFVHGTVQCARRKVCLGRYFQIDIAQNVILTFLLSDTQVCWT